MARKKNPTHDMQDAEKAPRKNAGAGEEKAQVIVRCTRKSGIWRAGRHWGPAPETVALDDLPEGAIEALEAEPLLEVTRP